MAKKSKKSHKKEVYNLIEPITDDFFKNPFESFFRPLNLPSTDIEDKGKEIEVNIDLPGIDKKDIKISVQKNILEVNAEKKKERKTERKNYFAHERSYSGFYRRYVLPCSVNVNKTKCDFKNGVLRIILPKLKEKEEKPKMIRLK